MPAKCTMASRCSVCVRTDAYAALTLSSDVISAVTAVVSSSFGVWCQLMALFLLVFVLLRFVYPLSKQKIDELQVEKEKLLSAKQ